MKTPQLLITRMPYKPLTHLECLSKLCIICHLPKQNLDPLGDNLTIMLEELGVVKNFSADHVPKSICGACRIDAQKPGGEEVLKDRRALSQPSIDEMLCYTLDGVCECKLCKIVKTARKPPSKNKGGRPKKRSISLVCTKCMDPDCSGIDCSGKAVKDSASKLIETNPRVAEAVTSQMIKNTEPSPKGTIRLAQGSGGGELPLTLGASSKKPKKVEVTTEEVNDLGQKLGIGVKGMREASKFLNQKFGRGTVESGHQQKLVEMMHALDGHFDLKEDCEFMDSEKKLVKKPLVYCKDLSEFVLCVINGRGYDLEATVVLFNVDNTEEFSQYFISILNLNEDPNAPLKSSGSTHSLLVAVSEKVPETNFNFKKVLTIIKAHKVKMLFANDLKADAELVGIQNAASTHPCIYCNTDDLSKCGDLRTIGSLCDEHQKWIDSGLNRTHLKEFENCANLPLLTDDYEADRDKEILDLCPPPGLHIMLGIVNQQVKILEKVIPNLVEEWVAYSQAKRVAYHGGIFEGNACKALVDKVDFLEMLVVNGPTEHNALAMSIIRVLRSFGKMRHSCYSKTLQPSYETDIDNYATAIENVVDDHDVSLILKNHIAKFHVKTWCSRNGIGLGSRSEQTGEASHKRFVKIWQRIKTTGLPFGKKLLKTACVLNSENAHFTTPAINCPHTKKEDKN